MTAVTTAQWIDMAIVEMGIAERELISWIYVQETRCMSSWGYSTDSEPQFLISNSYINLKYNAVKLKSIGEVYYDTDIVT
jgi:hypothetical protein